MAVQTPMPALEKVLRQTMEKLVDDMSGRGYVDGLSFKVRIDGKADFMRQLYTRQPLRTYDRPFTRKQHRANEWRLFKARWKRRLTKPYRTVRHRAPLVWDALRGIEHGDWY